MRQNFLISKINILSKPCLASGALATVRDPLSELPRYYHTVTAPGGTHGNACPNWVTSQGPTPAQRRCVSRCPLLQQVGNRSGIQVEPHSTTALAHQSSFTRPATRLATTHIPGRHPHNLLLGRTTTRALVMRQPTPCRILFHPRTRSHPIRPSSRQRVLWPAAPAIRSHERIRKAQPR